MNYSPQTWHDLPATDTPISAARLGYMESGIAASVSRGELVLNVKDYGAVGDGSTDDTAAIQSALNVAGGKTVFLPAATYMINANADSTNHIGLKMTQAATKLVLAEGAVLKVITNNLTNYALLSVTAADCVIEGGTFLGDVQTHTGSTGEWGHLIVVDTGGDRCVIQTTTVREAWGDGIIVQRGPVDVSVINVIADSNRRQGMSITGSTRTRVLGGVYKNTGVLGTTAPSAGIDVEPNPSSGYDVIGAEIMGVLFTGNKGEGLLSIRANAQTTDVMVTNCSAYGNGVGGTASGFRAGGTGSGTSRVRYVGCKAAGNTAHGFDIYAVGTRATSCQARANTLNGFDVSSSNAAVLDPDATDNGGHGIHVGVNGAQTASSVVIVGGVSSGNSQTTTNTSSNVSLDATVANIRIASHMSYAGGNTNVPKYGFDFPSGAGVRMFGSDVIGSFGTSILNNAANATVVPLPGLSRAAAITSPTAPSASYVQAEATAAKTAIDAIRAALTAAGITA